MRINDDLSRPVLVHAARQSWVASPSPGVDRRMLFRVGDEVARATSIVRYAPGSAFARHTHGGGEEFIVLDGVFQDEHGDYPAGAYIRNPPGTAHVPASKDGCTIFVRLWQFRAGDRTQVVLRPGEGRQVSVRPGGVSALLLFDDGHENVRLETWAAGARIDVENPAGMEFLVISGRMTARGEMLEAQSWGRLPKGTPLEATIGDDVVRIWLKQGPLLHADACRLDVPMERTA